MDFYYVNYLFNLFYELNFELRHPYFYSMAISLLVRPIFVLDLDLERIDIVLNVSAFFVYKNSY